VSETNSVETNPVERIVINLAGSATHCLDCGSMQFMHRLGCKCLDMTKAGALNNINVEHGFFKENKKNVLGIDDFISSEEIIKHVENNTADIHLQDGRKVTLDMII